MDRIKNNQYTFEVGMKVNKYEIEKAVKTDFKVDVIKVRTIVRKGKVKSTGRKRISKKLSKRKFAIVTIKEGQKIEAFTASQG